MGSSSIEGGEGDAGQPAQTFAQQLRGDGGVLRSRGHLGAALCKARQDVLLSVFVTRPAIWSPAFNLLQVGGLTGVGGWLAGMPGRPACCLPACCLPSLLPLSPARMLACPHACRSLLQ